MCPANGGTLTATMSGVLGTGRMNNGHTPPKNEEPPTGPDGEHPRIDDRTGGWGVDLHVHHDDAHTSPKVTPDMITPSDAPAPPDDQLASRLTEGPASSSREFTDYGRVSESPTARATARFHRAGTSRLLSAGPMAAWFLRSRSTAVRLCRYGW